MVEIWQANAAGRYAHPADTRDDVPLEEGFRGFGRSGTADDGWFEFVTVKPGTVPWTDGRTQAPHIVVGVFARGLLKRLVTRLYFPDEEEANAADPVLSGLDEQRAGDSRRAGRGRRAALRHPPPGRRADDVLRGMTTFGPLFVPERASRRRLGSRLARGNARGRERARERRGDERASSRPRRRPRSQTAAARSSIDFETLAREGRSVGNPAEPLVRALRERVGGDAARYVHWGATSQDVMDTASMLVARRALDLIVAELDRMRGRPRRPRRDASFDADGGAHAAPAGGPDDVRLQGRRLARRGAGGARTAAGRSSERLAAQLGGAAGTLAPLGERGVDVLRLFAEELGLAEPVLPWHTNRTRIAELGGALDDDRRRAREDRARRRAARADRGRRGARRPRTADRRRCHRSGTRSARRSHGPAPAS